MLLLSSQIYMPCAFAQENRLTEDGRRIAQTTAINLTAGAREAAQLLGITARLDQLQQIRIANPTPEGQLPGDEEFGLKVALLDRILLASLEVRMVADRIDRELAWAYMGKEMLEGKKQKYLNDLFTLNFMQGGVLGTIAGCEFLNQNPNTGAELLLVASTVGLMLSSVSALLQTQSFSKKIDGDVTFLADVYNLKQEQMPQHRTDIVLNFLNAVPPDGKSSRTRTEQLIDMWRKGGYLRGESSVKLNKLAALQPSGVHYRESTKVLGNRIRMLHDSQWAVEQLDAQLLDLLRAVE